MSVLTRSKVRFGPFELDPQSDELFKLGQKLNLHGQPIEVLCILLQRPGQLVTREEICKRLWTQDTFVDFEHSLNTAIKKLRQTLDDDPDAPRYIETLPKKGYRFVAAVESASNGVVGDADVSMQPNLLAPPEIPTASPTLEPLPSKAHTWKYPTVFAVILVIAAGVLYFFVRTSSPVVTGVHQLTRTGKFKSMHGYHQPVTDGTRVYTDAQK
jgi:DNA-binding winged helix-turn-helix (wHTH) protein